MNTAQFTLSTGGSFSSLREAAVELLKAWRAEPLAHLLDRDGSRVSLDQVKAELVRSINSPDVFAALVA